jgi:serine/threonine-protein kinase
MMIIRLEGAAVDSFEDDASEIRLPSVGPRTPDPAVTDGPERPGGRSARRGDVIGERYVVEGQIGRGGMGRVLQVRHNVLGKAFALKLPQRRVIASPEVRDRFHREAKLASSMSHHNICSIIDFGEDPRFGLFMVMELLEGVRLDYKLRRDGRLSPRVACDVIGQVAEALRCVHECGVIHGDIKSENILIKRTQDRRRVVKLLDFGLARTETTRDPHQVEGTPAYLAPERIAKHPASTASDIYALGILFWECLVGELPFVGPAELVFQRQLHEDLPPPSSRIDKPLEERADLIIARATAKRPKERHPDVAAFLYELRTLTAMLGTDTGRRREAARVSLAPRPDDRYLTAASEVFDNAPLPLASVDSHGYVRVANRAFRTFLGQADDASGLMLSETNLIHFYPTLLDDLQLVASDRRSIRQVISVPSRGGRSVRTLISLTPPPPDKSITAGDVHIAIHPLSPTRDGG